jgi:hypothetical protein
MTEVTTYDEHMGNLVCLNGNQGLLQIKLGQDNNFVASESTGKGNDEESVNMAEGKSAEACLRFDPIFPAGDTLICGELKDVRDDVSMGDHDCFLPSVSKRMRYNSLMHLQEIQKSRWSSRERQLASHLGP